ncbi:A disintegrin and metalloproteinase with thrombospondin motifs 20 isoform X1, partial [Lates japonicus]
CSVTCGRGTKKREIACVLQNQTKIEEEHCSHLPRPRTQKACRARGCPTWKANRWSETLLGRPVPFATAGDCYSAAKCPQGQFSINLIGTGLKVAEATKWTSQGNYVSVKVHRSEDGTRIYGRCGGFCGKCIPQAHNGLLLEVH